MKLQRPVFETYDRKAWLLADVGLQRRAEEVGQEPNGKVLPRTASGIAKAELVAFVCSSFNFLKRVDRGPKFKTLNF